jgi:hypothetical protein
MKVFLMFRDRDFDLKETLPSNAADLAKDLDLETLFRAMSGGDTLLFDIAKRAILCSLHEPERILYRQQVLADCLNRPATVREMYGIASEAIERERKVWGWMSARYPEGTLHRSIDVLKMFIPLLRTLRQIAEEHGPGFRSEGFRRLFEMFIRELDDEYFLRAEEHLARLAFRDGILMSAELGRGNKGIHYVLRKPRQMRLTWIERIQGMVEQVIRRDDSTYFYEIADRDEAGLQALSELRSRGIAHVAAALAQSADHILSFFQILRLELGFYIGCLNLREQLIANGEPTCLPEPVAPGRRNLSARGLYDPCLSLNMKGRVAGNDVAGDQKMLVMITGANRGGKSTLLRSFGVAQLMMQCGMFVPAEAFCADVAVGIFTHFKREEDVAIESGKLDEELRRMSSIVDQITPNSLVLLNESFASTNEREGSEIARQIVRALFESGVKVLYVTHMFDLAHSFYRTQRDRALFLRAERLTDGRRTFRVREGQPLPTSYGEDLYRRILAPDPAAGGSGVLPAQAPRDEQGVPISERPFQTLSFYAEPEQNSSGSVETDLLHD